MHLEAVQEGMTGQAPVPAAVGALPVWDPGAAEWEAVVEAEADDAGR
jgi:hypothetical protein